MSRIKTVEVRFRVGVGELPRLEAAAEGNRMTLGNWCRKWLLRAVEESEAEDRERAGERSDRRKERLYGELREDVRVWVP
jgi:hypothetical protein